MSREEFLARVRQAAQAGRTYRVHATETDSRTGYVGTDGEDICQVMAREVTAVGGFASIVESGEQAREQVMKLLQQYDATTVLSWQHTSLDSLNLSSALEAASIEMLDHPRLHVMNEADARTAYMAADVGITSCDIAVAETGSLIVCSKPAQERIASLVAPVHIAVVKREQIVPDLFDAFEQLTALGFDDIPSNISIITGPSKTGDIELTLTTGVHGPGKWHVIIIDQSN